MNHNFNINIYFKIRHIIIKYHNTYTIHIFIDAYNIIIKYDKSYYTYIKFFNKTTLKYLLYF